MRILITGGSGFLGINLARYLLSKSYARIRSLDIRGMDLPDAQTIEAVEGDVRDLWIVRAAMEHMDAVVHCAAALPLYPRRDIVSTEVDGTRTVIEEAARAGIGRLVVISSTAVYGIPDYTPVMEDEPLVGVGPYGKAKAAAENICEKWRSRGMCITVLRPKPFIGPERLGVLSLLFDWAMDGRGFPMIGDGSNRFQLLDVEDLCEAIRLCLENPPEAASSTFNIGAKEFATIREDFQAVLDEAGFGKRVVSLPAGPTIATLRLLEFLRLSPLYRWIYETVGRDSFVSIAKAEGALGYRPHYSNREALIRNLCWYRANRRRIAGNWGIVDRASWKQGALKIAKAFF